MTPNSRGREYAVLGLTVAGLFAASGVEHFVIHRQVLLPVMTAGVTPAPWMWGALFVPELLVCFAAGWRLRAPSAIALYALLAAVHRGAWQWVLGTVGEPGHVFPRASPMVELAASIVVYASVFALASTSARTPGFVPAPGE